MQGTKHVWGFRVSGRYSMSNSLALALAPLPSHSNVLRPPPPVATPSTFGAPTRAFPPVALAPLADIFEKILDAGSPLRSDFEIPAYFASKALKKVPDFFELLVGANGTGALAHTHQVRAHALPVPNLGLCLGCVEEMSTMSRLCLSATLFRSRSPDRRTVRPTRGLAGAG